MLFEDKFTEAEIRFEFSNPVLFARFCKQINFVHFSNSSCELQTQFDAKAFESTDLCFLDQPDKLSNKDRGIIELYWAIKQSMTMKSRMKFCKIAHTYFLFAVY